MALDAFDVNGFTSYSQPLRDYFHKLALDRRLNSRYNAPRCLGNRSLGGSTDGHERQGRVCSAQNQAACAGARYLPQRSDHAELPYDLIVDCGGRLVRAQVKYADGKCSQASGVVYLNLRKITRGNKPGKQFYTVKEVDVLIVYLPKIDNLLWFEPPHFHNRTSLLIRFEPSRNNQTKGYLMAEDYFW